jgi:hypothetical protein
MYVGYMLRNCIKLQTGNTGNFPKRTYNNIFLALDHDK